jgi:hypothetical protein
MRLSVKELGFLLFFLPIFFLKMINKVASDRILVFVSLICLFAFAFFLLYKKIPQKSLLCIVLLAIYTFILVMTSGKQGAFLSVVTIIALNNVNNKKNIYKICFVVGIAALLVFMYTERVGYETIRYMNGEWITMVKRSNILYIAFMAVVSLFLLQRRKLKWGEIGVISLLGYGMYLYTGSRTGLLSFSVFVFVSALTKIKFICRLKLFKWGCIMLPAICFLFSVITSYFYGKAPILNILDTYMQGRLTQGQKYISTYSLKLLGQRIFESTDPSNFWNLDCAYLDMLICYGVGFAFLWIVSSILVIRWLYASGRYAEMAMMVTYAVYGISETFLPNCFLNVSLFLYAEWIYAKLQNSQLMYDRPLITQLD